MPQATSGPPSRTPPQGRSPRRQIRWGRVAALAVLLVWTLAFVGGVFLGYVVFGKGSVLGFFSGSTWGHLFRFLTSL
ncbi:DNA-directed RNA polymerase subunit beta [Brockia lithotrophica]|uniref:DNA-directed RNA polymerase subunit beta n=1 Tax=Brockia lithotrophica TaxID=933949 RepID=A0A660KW83_9BACL|nr:DNA-directed RNA polymerase subunit beta [Brockia lithotrophica]RKQ83819.1 DNA-directed RNA polymerase subunit beta [Brockia lithotrophica]